MKKTFATIGLMILTTSIVAAIAVDASVRGLALGILFGVVLWFVSYLGLIPFAGPYVYWLVAWHAAAWILPGNEYVLVPVMLGLVVSVILTIPTSLLVVLFIVVTILERVG